MTTCINCSGSVKLILKKKDRFSNDYSYMKCQECGLIFEKDILFDQSKIINKISKIYNKDYFDTIDFGWKQRADRILKYIIGIIKVYSLFRNSTQILDYGGGNGYIAYKLSNHFDSVNYFDAYYTPKYKGDYNILTQPRASEVVIAIEVIEHLTSLDNFRDVLSLCKNNGIIIFTTVLTDFVKESQLKDWWYLNVDSGHTILYSVKSLKIIAGKNHLFYFYHPKQSIHVFIKNKALSVVSIAEIEKYIYLIIRTLKNILKHSLKITK